MPMTIAQVPEAGVSRPVPATLPFEQQARETNRAFAAFKTYLDLGPQRSLVLVAAKHGKSKTIIERWSRRFDWPARVKAYAGHVAEVERHAIERLAVENAVEWFRLQEPVKREAWKEAEETIVMVRKAREEWLAKGRLPGWEGMARMLELAFKLKQFATGMPNVVKEVNAHVTATIDVDWEIALRKAYGQTEVRDQTSEVRGQVVEVEEVAGVNAETLTTETLKGEVVDVEEVATEKAETLKPEMLKSNQSPATSAATEGKV